MDNQAMSDYVPPCATKATAAESTHSHTSGRHPHLTYSCVNNRKKRDRESGAKVLNELCLALSRSSLSEKPTKNQRKKMNRAARNEAQSRKQPSPQKTEYKGKKVQDTTPSTRKTRSMNGMLPLPFDNSHLEKLGKPSSFMTNDQIRTWIMSVYTPHLTSWYHDCLSAWSNQNRLKAAQDDPHIFTKAVLREAMDQHESSELLGSLLGEADKCPTAFHLQMKHTGSLSFVQHSAMVACLIVRDGQRDGAFAASNDLKKLHQAAVFLLTSVIVDLKTDSGYFLELFTSTDKGTALSRKEAQALSTLRTAKEEEKGGRSQEEKSEVSKTIRVPSKLFAIVGEALLGLHRTNDSKMDLQRPSGPGTGCRVVIVGIAGEVNEAEQVIQRLIASLSAPAEGDSMNLSV